MEELSDSLSFWQNSVQSTKINTLLKNEDVLNDDFWKSPEKQEKEEKDEKVELQQENQDELKPASCYFVNFFNFC